MWQSLNTEEPEVEMTTSFKLNFKLATFQEAYKGSKCHKAYLELLFKVHLLMGRKKNADLDCFM